MERKGTVFIAEDEGRFHAYWDLEPDGPPKLLENGPDEGWSDPDHALVWARSRATRVWIRHEEDHGHWWAGEGPLPAGDGILGSYNSRYGP